MITLTIRGRQMDFAEEDITKLVEEHMFLGPRPGVWFKVDPKTIDWSLFEQERENKSQEKVRKEILEARELRESWGIEEDAFETFIPDKTWDSMKIAEFVSYAAKFGKMADYTDQAFEWAQRISNGETWEEVCNNTDNNPWYRLVEIIDGWYRLVGGCAAEGYCYPATFVGEYNYSSENINGGELRIAVPLIMRWVNAD